MFISHLKENKEFIAGDKTTLRQPLHPDTHKLPINSSSFRRNGSVLHTARQGQNAH